MHDPGVKNVLCFGEALWDCLPEGRFVGGAPLNVAYHLSRLGIRAWPVTGVGTDALGDELVTRMRGWGLPVGLVALPSDKQTGIVKVSLLDGSPTYDIVRDVAWDQITLPDRLPDDCRPIAAVVYGSLAQRDAPNRSSLARLLDEANPTLSAFDVNMRAPFDAVDRIWQLASRANLVKVNDEEARALLGKSSKDDRFDRFAGAIAERVDCPRVCVTAGARGAGLLDSGKWHWVDGRAVDVRDTVGAGDAFLAALLHGLLSTPRAPERALTRAARLAEFVASGDGATPEYVVEDLL